jgi:hypothetical protein
MNTGGLAHGEGSDTGSFLHHPTSNRLNKNGSTFSAGIDALTDIGLMHRGSREAIVGRMKDMCRVRQEQTKFAGSLEEEIMQLEQGEASPKHSFRLVTHDIKTQQRWPLLRSAGGVASARETHRLKAQV